MPSLSKRELMALLTAAAVLPAAARRPEHDPAVTHANRIGNGAFPYREGWFGHGDDRLHYVTAGHGPLVIFYHGFPSFWYCWFNQLEALKTRYRVVAVDGLGAGLSAKPIAPERYAVPLLARQIDDLARHLTGRSRFALVGHDWGAALAFAYAEAFPQRLFAVSGFSAPSFNQFLDVVRASPQQQARSGYMQLFRALSPQDAGALAGRIFEQSYQGLLRQGQLTPEEYDLFRRAIADPLAINGGMNWYRANIPAFAEIGPGTGWPRPPRPIKVPAQLVWGEADRTFVDDVIANMQTAAPGIEVVRRPGVGHWTTMDQSVPATAALMDFLDRHRHR